MLYKRFIKFHFIQIFSYVIETPGELISDSLVGFFISKIFVIVCFDLSIIW